MIRVFSFTRLMSAAILTGIVSGIGAILFHYLADTFGAELFLRAQRGTWLQRLPVVLIIPTAGLFIVGLILQVVPESRRGGVRDVLESLERSAGHVPIVRLLNVFVSGLVLAFGGSVGPEGPMVQLGAVVGSGIGESLGLTRAHLQTIVRAGVAAGVAAAFRSPGGGVLLTLEVFGARQNQDLAPIAIAATFGYLTRTAFLADAYPFQPPMPMKPMPLMALLTVVPIMGLMAAVVGHVFILLFQRFQSVFPQRLPLAVNVALGGFIVGVIAIWYPQVLSAGYPLIDRVVHEGLPLSLLAILLVLKMVATSITFGSGAVGGLFAPTLVIGAIYGAMFGYGLHGLAPQLAPQPELFVLLGVVVMFGSIVKGYWSGLLMVADLTGSYHALLLPGLLAGGLSYFVSWEIHDRSIFDLAIDSTRPPEAGHRSASGVPDSIVAQAEEQLAQR